MLGPKQWPARVRLVSAQPTWVRESHTFRPPRDERSRLAVAPLYHVIPGGRDRMEQRGIRRQERFITTLIGNDGEAELLSLIHI